MGMSNGRIRKIENKLNNIKKFVNTNKRNKLFIKIHSKYIIDNISSYILDQNYIYKLILYSKQSQQKLNIHLLDYLKEYSKLKNELINLEDYIFEERLWESDKSINKLSNKLKIDLLEYKISEDNLKKYALNYFKKYLTNNEFCLYEHSKNIDLSSPLLEFLAKTDIFNKIFNIMIYSTKNKEYNSLYLPKIEELNKLNCHYSSIFLFYVECFDENQNYKNIITELNINFEQIKKIIIYCYSWLDINYNDLFYDLFKQKIQNNLVYFEFQSLAIFHDVVLENIDEINNLISLEYLILNDIYPKSPFILKLTNLKHLKLFKCSNIYFIENNFLKLKYLCLMSNHLTYKENELLKFPELNTLISDYEGSNYDSIMDLANLKNLKIFKGKSEHFLSLNNSESLEKLIIYSFGKQELKKIISLKALQEIEINEIFDNQLEYYGKNPSVKKLKICCCKSRGNFNLLYFLENFPNLNDLTIDINCIEPLFTCEWESHSKKYDEQIIIKEDSKSMINKILINLKSEGYVIKFNCAPYQNLEYIDLIIDRLDINNLPFF